MWNSTRIMAESIAKGIKEVDPQVSVKVFNIARRDKNDVITEIFKSKGIVLGSPTINKGYLSAIAALLEEIRGLGFKEKKATAFGSYGWSGEAVKLISDRLRESGWQVVNEGLKIQWKPDDVGIGLSIEFGKQVAKQLD